MGHDGGVFSFSFSFVCVCVCVGGVGEYSCIMKKYANVFICGSTNKTMI